MGEERRQGGEEGVEGTVLTLTSEITKSPPSPLTHHPALGGLQGQEGSSQDKKNQSLVPPRHSSTTLPQLHQLEQLGRELQLAVLSYSLSVSSFHPPDRDSPLSAGL